MRKPIWRDIRGVKVFHFEEIQEARRLLESNEAGGKIVVRVPR